ncbi:hypothetical protein MKQ68_10390 [Chitinophaga horti]|uniref:Uncharacterized protein n=1 Tax=Chitinophaga horti TaxID=2920382 RepID=A0ABY6J743_9BACT|nr:hypothetical protein [Chitinophaga horti]UYQ95508.1 hypothetical protein MKQ68_10390 [Chitinophaga horti]
MTVSSFISSHVVSGRVLYRNPECGLQVLDFSQRGQEVIERKGKRWLNRRYLTAAAYAKQVFRPELKELKALYDLAVRPGSNTYDRIVSDYNVPPDVLSVDGDYTGVPGEHLLLDVQDDFIVRFVQVSIYNAKDKLVEKGEALLQDDSRFFIYTTKRRNTAFLGSRVEVLAADMTHNYTLATFKIGLI